jgi:hypothetical protein
LKLGIYRLGNRAALEWILDQYKEKVIDLLMSVTTVSVRTVALVDLLKVRCVRGKANRSNLIIELMQPTSQELWSLNLEALLNGVKRMIFLFCWNFSKMSFQTSATG